MRTSSSTNLSFGKQILFATIAGSSLAITTNYEENNSDVLPSITANYSTIEVGYPWENMNSAKSIESDLDQYDTIISFAQRMIRDNKDIDFEFQTVVNKIFWDLI